MTTLRKKPYFWVTWLTPLLAGENSCYWTGWFKGNYEKYDKQERADSNASQLAEYEAKHTVLLNSLVDKYSLSSERIFIENQTKWAMKGTVANVGGKMDLISIGPNLVIDAKGGQPKSSHIIQVQIYLIAIELGVVPVVGGVAGEFTGLLCYPDGHEVPVAAPSEAFKQRFYSLIKRLATTEPEKVPSEFECRFCDIKECNSRYVEAAAEELEISVF